MPGGTAHRWQAGMLEVSQSWRYLEKVRLHALMFSALISMAWIIYIYSLFAIFYTTFETGKLEHQHTVRVSKQSQKLHSQQPFDTGDEPGSTDSPGIHPVHMRQLSLCLSL